jgi:hypothetical protein
MQDRIAAQPKELRSAFERATRLRRGEVSCFCLYFDGFVVVEFSDVGFAAYFYDREIFERRVVTGRAGEAADFRKAKLALERLAHVQGWQEKLRRRLRESGVYQDSMSHQRWRDA